MDVNKTSIEHNKFGLRSQPNSETGVVANLKLSMFNGCPSLLVFDGEEKEGEKVRPIRAASDILTLGVVFEQIASFANKILGEQEIKKKQLTLECLTCKRNEDGAPDLLNKYVGAKIVYGVNEDDCIYLEVLNKDRPHYRFVFGANEWHNFPDQTPSEISAAMARSWCKTMIEVAILDLHDTYDPEFYKKYMKERYGKDMN